MSSKLAMQKDIFATYEKFKQIFDLIKIKEEDFSKWLNRFKTYSDIRRVNNFFFSGKTPLLSALKIVTSLYRHFPPDEWVVLRAFAATMQAVKDLNQGINALKTIWKARPKPPRGSE